MQVRSFWVFETTTHLVRQLASEPEDLGSILGRYIRWSKRTSQGLRHGRFKIRQEIGAGPG